jgi:hypothetical protein
LNCLRRPFQGRALPVSYLGTVRSNDFTENGARRKVKTHYVVFGYEPMRTNFKGARRQERKNRTQRRQLRKQNQAGALFHLADDGEQGGWLDWLGEDFELVASLAGVSQKVERRGLTGEENHTAVRK